MQEKGFECFLVKANPNGVKFESEGSAVVGCFNSLMELV